MFPLPLNAHPRSNHPIVQHHPFSIPSSSFFPLPRSQNGNTALILASQIGQIGWLDVVTFLVNMKADLEATDNVRGDGRERGGIRSGQSRGEECVPFP